MGGIFSPSASTFRKIMEYKMTNPCNLCPFRNDDKRLTVPADRLREFARGEFCCHQTTEPDEETGDYSPLESSQHCAGLLIFREHMEDPHQMMRIVERLGMYDRTKLNMNAPVFQSWEEVEDSTPEWA